MQESQSQSDNKLPALMDHSTHRLPIRMNPSYRLKYSNPIRIGYLYYLEMKQLNPKLSESFLLEEFAKKSKLPHIPSNKYETRHYRYEKPNKQIVEPYKTPQLRYLNPDDSGVHQEDIDSILHSKPLKQYGSLKKIFISQ